MYINFQLAKTKGLTPTDVANLQLIYQNKLESLWEIITETVSLQTLDRYQQLGYVTLVKAKNKSDSIQNRVRLSKKGNEVLEDLQVPEVNSDDLQLYDWLESIYQKEDKEIGNRKKTKLYIALFRVQSGIDRNKLALLCKTFMNDSSQFEWSKRLEYLFFKPGNVFSVKFDLEQSKLYQYYIKHKEHFDNKFAKIDEDGN
jgi:DNA-binding PadR family transcriptional regulator